MRLTKEQKQALAEFTKKMLEEEKQKKMLINRKTDWGFLESLIQKANENPYLKVTVTTSDGTRLELATYKPNRRRDSIELEVD